MYVFLYFNLKHSGMNRMVLGFEALGAQCTLALKQALCAP